jgi:hypothetical protein
LGLRKFLKGFTLKKGAGLSSGYTSDRKLSLEVIEGALCKEVRWKTVLFFSEKTF